MGSLTDYGENKIADQILGATDPSIPITWYLALSTTTISDDGTGMVEPGSNYVRLAVTNNKTNWSTASGGSVSNAVILSFVQATGSWGTITDAALMDASSGGNMWGYGALNESKTIGVNDTFKFAIGDFTLNVT